MKKIEDVLSWELGRITTQIDLIVKGVRSVACETVHKSHLEEVRNEILGSGMLLFENQIAETHSDVYIYKHIHLGIVIKHMLGLEEEKEVFDSWCMGKLFGYSEEAMAAHVLNISAPDSKEIEADCFLSKIGLSHCIPDCEGDNWPECKKCARYDVIGKKQDKAKYSIEGGRDDKECRHVWKLLSSPPELLGKLRCRKCNVTKDIPPHECSWYPFEHKMPYPRMEQCSICKDVRDASVGCKHTWQIGPDEGTGTVVDKCLECGVVKDLPLHEHNWKPVVPYSMAADATEQCTSCKDVRKIFKECEHDWQQIGADPGMVWTCSKCHQSTKRRPKVLKVSANEDPADKHARSKVECQHDWQPLANEDPNLGMVECSKCDKVTVPLVKG